MAFCVWTGFESSLASGQRPMRKGAKSNSARYKSAACRTQAIVPMVVRAGRIPLPNASRLQLHVGSVSEQGRKKNNPVSILRAWVCRTGVFIHPRTLTLSLHRQQPTCELVRWMVLLLAGSWLLLIITLQTLQADVRCLSPII